MSETETIARNLSGELARHRKTQAALAKELGADQRTRVEVRIGQRAQDLGLGLAVRLTHDAEPRRGKPHPGRQLQRYRPQRAIEAQRQRTSRLAFRLHVVKHHCAAAKGSA